MRTDSVCPTSKRLEPWQDWATLVTGTWVFLSPWILDFPADHGASLNGWLTGAVVMAVTYWAVDRPSKIAPKLIDALAGLWLFLSPWLLTLHTVAHGAALTAWICGAMIFSLSIWSTASIGTYYRRER